MVYTSKLRAVVLLCLLYKVTRKPKEREPIILPVQYGSVSSCSWFQREEQKINKSHYPLTRVSCKCIDNEINEFLLPVSSPPTKGRASGQREEGLWPSRWTIKETTCVLPSVLLLK